MKKTIFLIFVLILIVVLFGSTISMAADYPAKLITLINPWSAGGGTDVVARTLAEELKSILGVNVIVVNKTGGSGAIGIAAAATSEPDGYTLFINDKSFISSYYMGVTKIRWDDMQPVCRLDVATHAIVIRNDAPWKTPQEFIDDAKARPGEITIGVSGIGGMSHLNAENFKIASGADIKIVSFEGAAKSVAALAGKHIDAMSAQLGEAKGFVDAGEFRWLAVGDDKRHPAYPDTPTFKESGVDFQLNQYRAIWAPKNTPMDRVKIIANAVEQAMKTESMEKILENTLCQNYFMGPEELTKELEKQDVILKNLVKDSGLLK